MKELRYTLLTDGSSDRALIPILDWLLKEHRVACPIQSMWADLRRLQNPPTELSERIRRSLELYPCDLLFVHRDAETESFEMRVNEIYKAIEEVDNWNSSRTICIVPVRMVEAWLFVDEVAIRRAAGNPQGQQPLQLPSVSRLEQIPDPKSVLYELMCQASGLSGRRLKNLRVSQGVRLITQFMNTFAPLRALSAFSALETEVEKVIQERGWASNS